MIVFEINVKLYCYHIYVILSFLAIPQILASPPDDSTLLGHPIKYSIIEDSKVKTPNDHVLVVDGFPSHISNIDQYLCVYLKNTTKVLSIKSCKVVKQKAFVEYESPEGQYPYIFTKYTHIGYRYITTNYIRIKLASFKNKWTGTITRVISDVELLCFRCFRCNLLHKQ